MDEKSQIGQMISACCPRYWRMGDLSGKPVTRPLDHLQTHPPEKRSSAMPWCGLDIVAEVKYWFDTLSASQERLLFSGVQRLEVLGDVHREAEVTLVAGR